jgi:hypothetical protein
MAMNAAALADEIKEAAGQSKETSKENKAEAEAIVEELQQMGLVTLATPFITGTCPSGGPLSGGQAKMGVILGISGPTLAARMAQKMGFGAPSPQLLGKATGIATHIMTGKVSFASGKVAGTCGNSPTSPGPFAGAASGGKIEGLDGSGMAALVSKGIGQASASPELTKVCKAICDHVQKNAEVMFAVVAGTCPPGGGPLVALPAVGGKIS